MSDSFENLKVISNTAEKMSIGICLGAIVLAYSSVCISEVANLLQAKNNLSDDDLIYQLSIITSCFNFGTLLSTHVLIYARFFIKNILHGLVN